jgi:hypothetical protein
VFNEEILRFCNFSSVVKGVKHSEVRYAVNVVGPEGTKKAARGV